MSELNVNLGEKTLQRTTCSRCKCQACALLYAQVLDRVQSSRLQWVWAGFGKDMVWLKWQPSGQTCITCHASSYLAAVVLLPVRQPMAHIKQVNTVIAWVSSSTCETQQVPSSG
eukprot:229325-Amphidinium_carterae.1